MFLEYCELDDLKSYRETLTCPPPSDLAARYPPEETAWKLLRDMSSALSWLHNKGYVHGDLKNANILVTAPPNTPPSRVSTEPIFKLADFSRLAPYGLPHEEFRFHGTWEFAPNRPERDAPMAPPVDIFALGATIQTFIYGYNATESRSSYANRQHELKARSAEYDNMHDFRSTFTRSPRLVIFRPIDVPSEALTDWDFADRELPSKNWKPYTSSLSRWYKSLMTYSVEERITGEDLKKYLLLIVDRRIEIERKATLAFDCMNKSARIYDGMDVRRLVRHMSKIRFRTPPPASREKQNEG